nr:unnamed protein product [Digitaria exilis]
MPKRPGEGHQSPGAATNAVARAAGQPRNLTCLADPTRHALPIQRLEATGYRSSLGVLYFVGFPGLKWTFCSVALEKDSTVTGTDSRRILLSLSAYGQRTPLEPHPIAPSRSPTSSRLRAQTSQNRANCPVKFTAHHMCREPPHSRRIKSDRADDTVRPKKSSKQTYIKKRSHLAAEVTRYGASTKDPNRSSTAVKISRRAAGVERTAAPEIPIL